MEDERALHPATLKLSCLQNQGSISEDEDRSIALICLLCEIVTDYKTPPKKTLREDLDKYLSKQIQCIVGSRPLTKGMGNIIKYVRHCISTVCVEMNESEAKNEILSKITSFFEERIQFAGDNIAIYISSIVRENETLLTFGTSSLVRKALLFAAQRVKFDLIIVDSRPLKEGLKTLRSLSPLVNCVFIPLSSAAAIMKKVSRVILGASCLLSNGAMLAPIGTATVASLAKSLQLPVIVAAESYKFTEKVQLDSMVFNEWGSEKEVICDEENVCGSHQLSRGFVGGESKTITRPFEIMNMRYDLTPICNISVVATETGLIPPTSVPVLIRELTSELKVIRANIN